MKKVIDRIYSSLKTITFLGIINITIFCLVFLLPSVAFIISIILIVTAVAIFLLEKWISPRLAAFLGLSLTQIDPWEMREDRKTAIEKLKNIFAMIYIIGIIFLAYKRWRKKAIILSIPTFLVPIFYFAIPKLRENTVIFFAIILAYIFARLYLRFALEINTSRKANIFLSILKILLEILRIVIILFSVLYRDSYLNFAPPSSLLEAIVATIAIDFIWKELEKQFPKKDESLENKNSNTNNIRMI